MIKEYEGKTEKEAIDRAVSDLALDRDVIDVEIVESTRKGLFKKGTVKIRVHVTEDDDDLPVEADPPELEGKIADFIEELIDKMGYPGKVTILCRQENKTVYGISSPHSSILIGKKGKNLDAIQLLANVFASKEGSERRVIVDAESYRSRREESLVRLAEKTADQVRRNGGSRLLEPMNPFERRLIHTTLSGMEGIETKSEGEGLIKQVRVIYKGR
jgi:spoIIIJ-associated protein